MMISENNKDHLMLEMPTGKLDLKTPRIMAVLNLTPDSFYKGNRYLNESDYLSVVGKKLEAGADIIDIGAVSTRPGAKGITEKEELDRLMGPLKKIRKHYPDIFISVDTYRSNVARKAVDAGADIINDISGGTMDDQMLDTMTELNIPFVMMHIRGTPETMQQNPAYENVVKEVNDFFLFQIKQLREKGFSAGIVLDPGFGFGKTVEHNYELLRHIETFKKSGFPVMAGVSRKSMVNRVLKIQPEDALNGTTVLNTLALLNGASILRVHDVKEARDAVILIEYYKQFNTSS